MVQVQQRLLAAALLLACWTPAQGRKFYDDDPLRSEPKPVPVKDANSRKLNEYYDFFSHTFALGKIADLQEEHAQAVPAQAVNTLGEPLDSAWYRHRHSRLQPMSLEALRRGPGDRNAPVAPWVLLSGKTEGITPGFQIQDAKGRRYLIKLDPKSNPELASAADVIGSKLFHALGYNVPENYIVRFARNQLRITEKSKVEDDRGVERQMTAHDLEKMLAKAPRTNEGEFRAMASLYIAGKPLGPFRYHATRTDDPNDIVPHEHRRDLRSLYVFSAWLNHTDTKSLNSADFLVKEDGVSFVKHYLIDFGATLGSDSFEAKSPRAGNVYLFDAKPAAGQFFSLGLYVPPWMLADFPNLSSVGRFEAALFDPLQWKNNYPNPAFHNVLPDDGFWGAKQVMAFTDEQIRALVSTGQYSDPAAADYVSKVLIERRDKTGRAWFAKVLPLDHFRVANGRLEFDDLGAVYGFSPAPTWSFSWSVFDNAGETLAPLPDATGPALPRNPAPYLAAAIHAGDPAKAVTVYLRQGGRGAQVVGIGRKW
jgi:hypothetical protein